jgi:hypothetical protein
MGSRLHFWELYFLWHFFYRALVSSTRLHGPLHSISTTNIGHRRTKFPDRKLSALAHRGHQGLSLARSFKHPEATTGLCLGQSP